jgi:hypothetical protein
LKLLIAMAILVALGSGARIYIRLHQYGTPSRDLASSTSSLALPDPQPSEPPLCKDFYRSVCGQQQDGRDPTGIVRTDVEGERLAVGYLKDIINKHPDWSSDQIDEELIRQIYTPERRGRIEAAYHWVEYRIEHFIDSQPDQVFTTREKKEIIQRLRKTELQLPPTTLYTDEPDLYTKNDVYYERTPEGQLRMRVGGAYLFTAKSWFNIVFTLGHELGHSIDPCEIRAARLSYPAYDRLTACFLKTGIVNTTKQRSECEDNDQLSEAFADWIGAKVSSEALKNFSTSYQGLQLTDAAENSVRDLCDQGDLDDLDIVNHPSPKVRIEKIYGGNPEIRSLLGCSKPSVDYCSFESVLPLKQGTSL